MEAACDRSKRKRPEVRTSEARRDARKQNETHHSDDRVDEVDTDSDLFRVVSGDETVQVLLGVVTRVLRSSLPLLDRTLSPDTDSRSRLLLHALLGVSSRSKD